VGWRAVRDKRARHRLGDWLAAQLAMSSIPEIGLGPPDLAREDSRWDVLGSSPSIFAVGQSAEKVILASVCSLITRSQGLGGA